MINTTLAHLIFLGGGGGGEWIEVGMDAYLSLKGSGVGRSWAYSMLGAY